MDSTTRPVPRVLVSRVSRARGAPFTLGEGPCIDVYASRVPVLEPDLAAPDLPRWVVFARAATEAGARAVFAFPLQVGVARIGTIDLYRDQPGMLCLDQLADVLTATDLAAATMSTSARWPNRWSSPPCPSTSLPHRPREAPSRVAEPIPFAPILLASEDP